uniref:S-phase kinase associated protein 2 n=1 Tax=Leptobrachium leishanense TaxID=445787 RepID=A0A8C5LH15_9ANUR
MERRPLQPIPTSSRSGPNINWSWASRRNTDLMSGMGVSPMEKDPQDIENTPQEQVKKLTPPAKREAPKEKDDKFVLARRPRFSMNKKSATSMSWHLIPDELLLNAFSYLHLTDLLRVSRVCKKWYRLSLDESLWYSLDMCGSHVADGVLGKLLPCGVVVFRCPRTSIGEPMFKDVRSIRLQHVDLSNCSLSTDSLQSILSRCYKLQNLTLEGVKISDDVMRSLAQNPDLFRLNLSGCSGFSPYTLATLLKNCTKLKGFNLSWCYFTADHVQATIQNLPSSLTELNLCGYRQHVALQDVETIVTRCPNLIILDLSDSILLTADCFTALKRLHHLQDLGLSRCYQLTTAEILRQSVGFSSPCPQRLWENQQSESAHGVRLSDR